jgi:hypothetical protein
MSLQIAVDHLRHGRWEQAHEIVHGDDARLACWAHAIVHLQEGDVDNARYWFGRADRQFSSDIAAELKELAAAIETA